MKQKLLITGKPYELILSVTLGDILKCVENPLDYFWKILWIEGIGEIEGSMLEFEKKINTSLEGVLFSYLELLKISDAADQLIEILIVADKNLAKLIRYEDDAQMYKYCDYVIELIDSSFWEFTTSVGSSINKLKQNIEGVSGCSDIFKNK